MAHRSDWDRKESSIMSRTKEAQDVSGQERNRRVFKREGENLKTGQKRRVM